MHKQQQYIPQELIDDLWDDNNKEPTFIKRILKKVKECLIRKRKYPSKT